MTSDMIRTTLGVVLVTLLVAFKRRPETQEKTDVQKVHVRR